MFQQEAHYHRGVFQWGPCSHSSVHIQIAFDLDRFNSLCQWDSLFFGIHCFLGFPSLCMKIFLHCDYKMLNQPLM